MGHMHQIPNIQDIADEDWLVGHYQIRETAKNL